MMCCVAKMLMQNYMARILFKSGKWSFAEICLAPDNFKQQHMLSDNTDDVGVCIHHGKRVNK